ncbi:MAG: hypothetical protein EXS49_02510 [Candidatus Pacebacteria bacterium]|nr:hypothetical protein [Candidatus Paceibacterota bacterium]
MLRDPLHEIEHATKKANEFMGNKTQGVFGKYPITLSFLVLFGVMSVLHGFDDIIFKIPFFSNHPIFVFILGIVILIFTGSLYKRLQKNID